MNRKFELDLLKNKISMYIQFTKIGSVRLEGSSSLRGTSLNKPTFKQSQPYYEPSFSIYDSSTCEYYSNASLV